jgi:two-component system, chemotaxis family, chemotaxis protein CheY
MKILLIDDSRTMRSIQKNVLKALGEYECAEAGDGIEGLTAIAACGGHFDLILVDWNMPKMDGLTFVKTLRDKDKVTPVIMVTTEAEKVRIIEAVKAGVSNYVIKPFTPDALMERVNTTLAKAKAAVAAA